VRRGPQGGLGSPPGSAREGARGGSRREYTSVVFAGSEPRGPGHGLTKQEAEQDAARAALQSLTGGTAAKPAKLPRSRRAPRKPREKPSAAEPEPEAVGQA